MTKSFGIFWVVPFLSDDRLRARPRRTSVDMNALMRPLPEVGVEPLLVERPAAAELGPPVGDRDVRVGLVGELDRRLERRVAAPHDQDPLARVLPRVDQPVGDLLELLARDAHRARRPAPPDRQDHPLGADDPPIGRDEEVVLRAVDPGELRLLVDLDARLGHDLLKRADQILLSNELSSELSVERQVDGLGHDQLLARVVGHGSADRVLLEERVGEAGGSASDRGRDPGRSRAHDDDVDAPGVEARSMVSLRRAATWSPWMSAFLMRPIPASSPTMWTPSRLVSKNSSTSGSSTPRSAEPKTSLMASTGHSAAHLPCPMHLEALTRVATPSTRPEDLPLGTGADARAAADADVRIDDRMERHRDVQLQLDGLCQLLLGAPVLPPAPEQVGGQTKDSQRQRSFEQMLVRRREEIHHSGNAPGEAGDERRKERRKPALHPAGWRLGCFSLVHGLENDARSSQTSLCAPSPDLVPNRRSNQASHPIFVRTAPPTSRRQGAAKPRAAKPRDRARGCSDST